jgi:hypothetical protein
MTIKEARTLKEVRRSYYKTRARPETHELHVSRKDTMKWLLLYHSMDLYGFPLAMFVSEVLSGRYEGLCFKGILVKLNCDGPTGFVEKGATDAKDHIE